MAMKNPPRRTTIRGQKHLLAYITPDEAQLLMDNGGTGEPGPMGIPAFYEKDRPGLGGKGEMGDKGGFGGDFGGGGKDNDKGAVDPGLAKAVAEKAAQQAATVSGPVSGGISPGQSQAMFGTTKYAGLGTEQAISAAKSAGNQFAGGVEKARAIDIQALQNLNKQLEDLSRREALAKSRLYSPFSFIPGVGMANYFGLQNVRNLAASAIGSPPGLLAGFGFGEKVSPDFSGLGVSELVGLQSQAVTDNAGNIVGFKDKYGNLKYGTDPDAEAMGDGRDTVPASYNPNTGEAQCPDGYMFDEDLQACRLAGGLPGGDGKVMTTSGPYAEGDYARMGLLDVAPMGMGLFAQRYGAGFGTPQDFSTANLAFRRGAATRPQYFKQAPDLTGYTLLS